MLSPYQLQIPEMREQPTGKSSIILIDEIARKNKVFRVEDFFFWKLFIVLKGSQSQTFKYNG